VNGRSGVFVDVLISPQFEISQVLPRIQITPQQMLGTVERAANRLVEVAEAVRVDPQAAGEKPAERKGDE
jgi:hypothetical protein